MKAFERVRTVTNPTPIPTPFLTLVIYKTEAFCATLNPIKNQNYERLRRVSQTFSLESQTGICQICVLIGLSQVGFFFCYLPKRLENRAVFD